MSACNDVINNAGSHERGDQVDNSTIVSGDVRDLRQYQMKEVALNSDIGSCWLVIKDFVYDVTPFIKEHPGGWEVIMEYAGRDATHAFEGKGHSAEAKAILAKYQIGQLTKSERLEKG